MFMPPPFSGITRALYIIALALGYFVCINANKQEKFLKSLGLVIGACIIILSGLLLLGNIAKDAAFMSGTCNMSSPMMMRSQWQQPGMGMGMMKEMAPMMKQMMPEKNAPQK